jgi:mannose-1-phosphate guanylyltransferase/mannose-6-phosphate isomerase
MASHSIHPVVLCGGLGLRLWPASTRQRPKPFLVLTGESSLLQQTTLRVAGVAGAQTPIILTDVRHAALVRHEVSRAGVACRLIAEPGGRSSAPAIAAAALEIVEHDPEGLALVVASDHYAPDTKAFRAGVESAAAAAADGAIVTFGVRPSRPSDAYGYVLPGDALNGQVRAAARFVEKPTISEAESLVAGGWLWNSGNFLFRADVLLGELERFEPELMAAVRKARDNGARERDELLLSEAFLSAPNIAIDVAVMERSDRVAVLPVDYAWSDLGAWDAVLAAVARDGSGNAVQGRVVAVDSEGCLIRGDAGLTIVAVGLRDIAVVAQDGQILVCDLASSQMVKAAVQEIDKD